MHSLSTLHQTSLTRGKENKTKQSFLDTLQFLLAVNFIRFGEFIHQLITKIVLDLCATWKFVQRYEYKVIKASEEDIVIKVESQIQQTKSGREKELDSCIFCSVEVHGCHCSKRVPWNRSKNAKDFICLNCYNVIQNFGAVNYF
jgi:hypothetical protein